MINKDKIKEVIKSYLPQAEDNTLENIAHDIVGDAEAIIYSMVRHATVQERENLYWKNKCD